MAEGLSAQQVEEIMGEHDGVMIGPDDPRSPAQYVLEAIEFALAQSYRAEEREARSILAKSASSEHPYFA